MSEEAQIFEILKTVFWFFIPSAFIFFVVASIKGNNYKISQAEKRHTKEINSFSEAIHVSSNVSLNKIRQVNSRLLDIKSDQREFMNAVLNLTERISKDNENNSIEISNIKELLEHIPKSKQEVSSWVDALVNRTGIAYNKRLDELNSIIGGMKEALKDLQIRFDQNRNANNYIIGTKYNELNKLDDRSTKDLTTLKNNYTKLDQRSSQNSQNIVDLKMFVNNIDATLKKVSKNLDRSILSAVSLSEIKGRVEANYIYLINLNKKYESRYENIKKDYEERLIEMYSKSKKSTKEIVSRTIGAFEEDLRKLEIKISEETEFRSKMIVSERALRNSLGVLSSDVQRYLQAKVTISSDPEINVSSAQIQYPSSFSLSSEIVFSLAANPNVDVIRNNDRALLDTLAEIGF